MTQGADLLRLLEPAVRPVSPVKPASGGSGASGVTSGELPFEAQDFDSLLASARDGFQTQDAPAEEQNEVSNPPQPPGPLDALADFGRIENPGLRELLAQQRSLTSSNESPQTPTAA